MTAFSALLDGDCRLALEPLHPTDPPGPVVHGPTGVTVVGSAVLEAPAELAAALGAPRGAHPLSLIATAYLKWGRRFTEHLAGEYAFALWDPEQRLLVCGRDGFGIRRLYIGEGNGTIVATNRLATALSHPRIDRSLDARTIASFLANGSVRDPARTFYEHVRLVPPGHTLVVNARRNHSELFRHWVPPSPAMLARDVPERYSEALRAAVRDRLSLGTTAILLSGGIDSATMAAAARDAAPDARLHAVTCEYAAVDARDELACAEATAAVLHMPLDRVPGDAQLPLHHTANGVPLPQPVDEPTLADWRELVGAAARHSTVILHGEDGDSVLFPPDFRAMLQMQTAGSIALATARYTLAHGRLPYLGMRLRERLGLVRRRVVPAPPEWLTPEARRHIQKAPPATVLGHAPVPAPVHATHPDTFRRLENVASALAPTIAPETTHVAAELRYPLLDSRVLAVVLAAPAIPWLQAKQLPRVAFGNRLPRHVIDRPKTPIAGAYEAAVAAWRARPVAWQPAAELRAWVDVDSVRAVLGGGADADVLAAWRALLVSDWLERREVIPCTR